MISRRVTVLPLVVLANLAQMPATTLAPTAPAARPVRTNLQRHDLSIPGREAGQLGIDVGAEVYALMNTHPGEEVLYVLQGSLEYEIRGGPSVTLKGGDVLFIAA